MIGIPSCRVDGLRGGIVCAWGGGGGGCNSGKCFSVRYLYSALR